LDRAGADVSDPQWVTIPSYLVEKAPQTAPKSFTLYKRDDTPYIRLAGNRTYYGAILDQPEYLDPKTGVRTVFKIRDQVAICRLIDLLPNIAWLYTAGWSGYSDGISGVLADRVSLVLAL
jgi:trimethylamine:corrinoid methyltransferase-like protein